MVFVGAAGCDCEDKSQHCAHWATQTTMLISSLWFARFDLPPTLARVLAMLPGLLDRLPVAIFVCKEAMSVSYLVVVRPLICARPVLTPL